MCDTCETDTVPLTGLGLCPILQGSQFKQMTSIRFTYDIHTHQKVYAIVKTDGSYTLTTSITNAISISQQDAN